MRKVLIFCIHPLMEFAGWRFRRTGKAVDYWRHEYWIMGSKRMAEHIIHQEKLIMDLYLKLQERK